MCILIVIRNTDEKFYSYTRESFKYRTTYRMPMDRNDEKMWMHSFTIQLMKALCKFSNDVNREAMCLVDRLYITVTFIYVLLHFAYTHLL